MWAVDPLVYGNWCGTNLANLALWRRDSRVAGAMTVSSQGQTTRVVWNKGQNRVGWPAALPAREGWTYSFQIAGGGGEIILHQLGEASSLQELAGQLADKQCYQQLGILLGS